MDDRSDDLYRGLISRAAFEAHMKRMLNSGAAIMADNAEHRYRPPSTIIVYQRPRLHFRKRRALATIHSPARATTLHHLLFAQSLRVGAPLLGAPALGAA
jgi:hypothetical protein